MGFSNVIVEMDSANAYHLISYDVPSTHAYASLICVVQSLISQDRNVKSSLIFREVNRYADSLAKKGHKLLWGLLFLIGFQLIPIWIS